MVKKEVRNYLSIGVLVLAVLAVAYIFNVGVTGFAVFVESGEDFNGTFNNTFFDSNLSGVVILENETIGTYISEVFDSGNELTTWNNLTWTGSQELVFEVRACSDSVCANESFASADLENLNLTGQYFQYSVLFDANSSNETLVLESVSLDYSLPEPEEEFQITIISPTNTVYETTEVVLNVSANEEVGDWWYVINEGNSTFFDPLNSSILLEDGTSYTLIVYANNTQGQETNSSVAFSVLIPACSNDLSLCEDQESCEGEGGGYWYNSQCNSSPESSESEEDTSTEETETEQPQQTTEPQQQEVGPQTTVSLSAGNIGETKMAPGSLKDVSWSVKNNGEGFLFSCAQFISSEFSGWVSFEEETRNINPGEEQIYSFSISVPEETNDGDYSFSSSLTCSTGESVSESFIVSVEKEKISFEVIDAQRTRSDRVRVIYELTELVGEDQNVELTFYLFDLEGEIVAKEEENKTLEANSSEEFRLNMLINESLEGEINLLVDYNSELYSSSVEERIVLGAPIGGFAILEGIGAGEAVIFVVVLLVLVAIFVFTRRMKKSGKTLKDLLEGKSSKK